MRILFAGTPGFACPVLQALLDAKHNIGLVLTQPDRPAGRGRKLTASPVKQLAEENGLAVAQPEQLRTDWPQALSSGAFDVGVVVAYGLILPQTLLDHPRLGCVNVHASLLPRWRGAAPIQRAIQAGDAATGVSIMQMEAGLDTGPVLLQRPCAIRATDTAADVHDRLAILGADTLIEALHRMQQDQLAPVPQDHTAACYARKLSKAEAQVDWRQSAVAVQRHIHAMNPVPVAWSGLQGKNVRLWQVCADADHDTNGQPAGTMLAWAADGPWVATGQGAVQLLRCQFPGKQQMAAADLKTHPMLQTGQRFAQPD